MKESRVWNLLKVNVKTKKHSVSLLSRLTRLRGSRHEKKIKFPFDYRQHYAALNFTRVKKTWQNQIGEQKFLQKSLRALEISCYLTKELNECVI